MGETESWKRLRSNIYGNHRSSPSLQAVTLLNLTALIFKRFKLAFPVEACLYAQALGKYENYFVEGEIQFKGKAQNLLTFKTDILDLLVLVMEIALL